MPDDSGHRWPPAYPDRDAAEVTVAPSGALRAWFHPGGVRVAAPPFAPREVARAVLRGAGQALNLPIPVDELRDHLELAGPGSLSVRFIQDFKGVPVDASEVVVNLYYDGRVHSIYSRYHDDIPPALDPARPRIDPLEVRQIVARLTRGYRHRRIGPARLVVYRYSGVDRHPPRPRPRTRRRERFLAAVAAHRARGRAAGFDPAPGQHFLAWDVRVATERPRHRWRVLVDAASGHVIEVIDLIAYATGQGKVFDPNPIVTSGDTSLSSSSRTSTLNAERVTVPLPRLDPKDDSGYLHLDGAWVQMDDLDDPRIKEPRSKKGSFKFGWKNKKFLNVMVYFHIDRFQHYVQEDLRLPGIGDFSVPADAQGLGNDDNSQGAASGVSYGKGPVPDASDGMVVLHEYGHVIQDSSVPGSNIGNQDSGVSEGFPDVLAAVYYDDKHAGPLATRGHMFSWETNAGDHAWVGRRYDRPWRFDGPEFAAGNGYVRAEVWSSAVFELYRKLGGDSATAAVQQAARDLLIRLHIMANFGAAAFGATATEFAEQLIAADASLGGWRYPDGLHAKVIRDTFARRGLPGWAWPPPVDVYVDDGRAGGYGSPLANPAFADRLWLEPFDQAADVWTTKAQYPAANQAAGTPADHVAQQAGLQAFLYARVRNRGNDPAGSGALTVLAFHAAATGHWPGAWTPADVPSIAYANIPAGGSIVAGPFPFTPASASPSLLVVVECARDRALTQDLPGGVIVRVADFVPFDNNIALRRV